MNERERNKKREIESNIYIYIERERERGGTRKVEERSRRGKERDIQ